MMPGALQTVTYRYRQVRDWGWIASLHLQHRQAKQVWGLLTQIDYNPHLQVRQQVRSLGAVRWPPKTLTDTIVQLNTIQDTALQGHTGYIIGTAYQTPDWFIELGANFYSTTWGARFTGGWFWSDFTSHPIQRKLSISLFYQQGLWVKHTFVNFGTEFAITLPAVGSASAFTATAGFGWWQASAAGRAFLWWVGLAVHFRERWFIRPKFD